MKQDKERAAILAALDQWIRQRPGLDYGNYGDPASYRAEVRSIGRDLQDARALLRYVELRESISGKMLKEAFRAFSGRLTWDGKKLDYCTGQYWPTEYRRAACAVLSQAIWDWLRDECMPKPFVTTSGEKTYNGLSAGDYIRKAARRELGRRIQSRWMD